MITKVLIIAGAEDRVYTFDNESDDFPMSSLEAAKQWIAFPVPDQSTVYFKEDDTCFEQDIDSGEIDDRSCDNLPDLEQNLLDGTVRLHQGNQGVTRERLNEQWERYHEIIKKQEAAAQWTRNMSPDEVILGPNKVYFSPSSLNLKFELDLYSPTDDDEDMWLFSYHNEYPPSLDVYGRELADYKLLEDKVWFGEDENRRVQDSPTVWLKQIKDARTLRELVDILYRLNTGGMTAFVDASMMAQKNRTLLSLLPTFGGKPDLTKVAGRLDKNESVLSWDTYNDDVLVGELKPSGRVRILSLDPAKDQRSLEELLAEIEDDE